jgi:hypothetical protein
MQTNNPGYSLNEAKGKLVLCLINKYIKHKWSRGIPPGVLNLNNGCK